MKQIDWEICIRKNNLKKSLSSGKIVGNVRLKRLTRIWGSLWTNDNIFPLFYTMNDIPTIRTLIFNVKNVINNHEIL